MFALLEHTTRDGVHWDLLLEVAEQERLRTWRLAVNPLRGAAEIAVQQLADHRREYLEFEGDISGERGHVRRLDRGAAEWLRTGDCELRIRLSGERLRAVIEIVADADGAGLLRLHPAIASAQ